MSEMPELKIGDEIVAGNDKVPVYWMVGREVVRREVSRAWRVIGVGVVSDYAVRCSPDSKAGSVALTCATLLEMADLTIRRKGKQIWPVVEPNIACELRTVIVDHYANKAEHDHLIDDLMKRFTITRKDK